MPIRCIANNNSKSRQWHAMRHVKLAVFRQVEYWPSRRHKPNEADELPRTPIAAGKPSLASYARLVTRDSKSASQSLVPIGILPHDATASRPHLTRFLTAAAHVVPITIQYSRPDELVLGWFCVSAQRHGCRIWTFIGASEPLIALHGRSAQISAVRSDATST